MVCGPAMSPDLVFSYPDILANDMKVNRTVELQIGTHNIPQHEKECEVYQKIRVT